MYFYLYVLLQLSLFFVQLGCMGSLWTSVQIWLLSKLRLLRWLDADGTRIQNSGIRTSVVTIHHAKMVWQTGYFNGAVKFCGGALVYSNTW